MSPTDRSVQPGSASGESELSRLRAQVARLEAEKVPVVPGDRTGWWRTAVAGVLVMVAALLVPLSVLATWAHGQVEDTDRYLETVAPLASDRDVQDAVAARIEQVVFGYVDVDAAVDDVVEAVNSMGVPRAAAITVRAAAGPLASGMRSFVSERIHEFVRSDAFAQAWVAANRAAHPQLVAALTGKGDAVTVRHGQVSVELATIIGAVKGQLIDAGFGLAAQIPTVDATFTFVQSDELATVQRLLGLLDGWSTWLPLLGLGLLGLAVLVARDRRRMVLAGALAVATSMLLLGATLNAVRMLYLDSLPATSSTAAAGVVYDQLVSFIRFALRGILVMAIAVAVGAWLMARDGAGAAGRTRLGRGIDAVRRGGGRAGLRTGRLGSFLGQYRAAVRTIVLAGASLWYVSLDHPSGGTAVRFVVVTAALLVVAGVLAAGPASDAVPEARPLEQHSRATGTGGPA